MFRRVDAGGIQFGDGDGAKIVLPLPKIHRLQHFRRGQRVHHRFVVAKDVQHGTLPTKRAKFKTFALRLVAAGPVLKKLKFGRITPVFPLGVRDRHVLRFHLFHFVAVDDDVHDALVQQLQPLDVLGLQQATLLTGAFSFPLPSSTGVAQFVATPADFGAVGVGFALRNPKIETLRGRPAKDCLGQNEGVREWC